MDTNLFKFQPDQMIVYQILIREGHYRLTTDLEEVEWAREKKMTVTEYVMVDATVIADAEFKFRAIVGCALIVIVISLWAAFG